MSDRKDSGLAEIIVDRLPRVLEEAADARVFVAKRRHYIGRDQRVEFTAQRIRVIFNGKPYIEMEDRRISGSGAVGVWTKADSVTLFDDFSFGAK